MQLQRQVEPLPVEALLLEQDVLGSVWMFAA